MNPIHHIPVPRDATIYQTIAYDYERIGPVKVDWLGLILLALIIIWIARIIRDVIRYRAARRSPTDTTH